MDKFLKSPLSDDEIKVEMNWIDYAFQFSAFFIFFMLLAGIIFMLLITFDLI